MTRFTERLERDLDQIADRATPSSTAWETIQHRIGEQTTEPTVEVIMLNPDQKKPYAVSTTWLAVAASLVVIVLVAAVLVLQNRNDDLDTIDQPDVTVPLELDGEQPDVTVPDATAPTVSVPDADAGDAELGAPAAPLAMTGDVIADCVFGEGVPDPADPNQKSPQSCVFRDTGVVPFEAEQEYIITIYQDPEFHDPDAGPFVPVTGLSDSGFMYAGYLWDGQPESNGRFVGVADGVGPYEGMLIHVSGRSFGGDNGVVHMQWVAGDDLTPLTLSGTDATPEEMTDDCQFVEFVEDEDTDARTEQFITSCTSSGNESQLLRAPRTVSVNMFGIGPNELGVGDYRYVIIPGADLVAGLGGADGKVLSIGVSVGEGEFEGMMIHEMGAARADGDGRTVGINRRWALPPAE